MWKPVVHDPNMTTIMVQKAEHFTRSTTGRGGNCGCGEGVGNVWTVPITPTPSIAFQHLLCVINQCLEFAHHHVGIVMFRTVARREKHTGTLKALLHFRHCGCARIDYSASWRVSQHNMHNYKRTCTFHPIASAAGSFKGTCAGFHLRVGQHGGK